MCRRQCAADNGVEPVAQINPGQRAAARSFRATSSRAAGRYRVTDSPAFTPAEARLWLPFNFASFARLRAFLMRQCR